MRVDIHPRVMTRHPELSEEDVLTAWHNFVRKTQREEPSSHQYCAVGFDNKGRLIEMVAAADEIGYIIYHAMTPPTEKLLKELGLSRRQR